MKIFDRVPCFIGNSSITLGVFGVCLAFGSTSLYTESRSCFDEVNLEASFIAFTTNEHSKLADWYKRVFGLETAKEFSFPDGNVIGILKQCLVDQGVKAGRIFNDKNLGIDLLQVVDPELNVLEIISCSWGPVAEES
ncbi:MAG: hypothetical protein ACI9GW_000285 [Halieaceae bacterium]|jgi:hypothetical protein